MDDSLPDGVTELHWTDIIAPAQPTRRKHPQHLRPKPKRLVRDRILDTAGYALLALFAFGAGLGTVLAVGGVTPR